MQILKNSSVSQPISVNAVPPVEIQILENPQSKCFDFDEVKNLGFVNIMNINRIYSPYPEKAIKQKIQGTVVVEVLVDEKGSVQCVRNISGHQILAKSVKSSAYQLRFSPYNTECKNIRFRGYYVERFGDKP